MTQPIETTASLKDAKRIVLVSQLALYPQHWAAFVRLCEHWQVREPTVIMPTAPDLPSVHRSLGWVTREQAEQQLPGVRIIAIDGDSTRGQAIRVFCTVRQMRADVVWVQEEPHVWLTLVVLLALRFRRKPRIVVAACENIFPRPRGWRDVVRRWLWRRVDAVAAVADASIDGLRDGGMPTDVATATLVAGNFPAPIDVEPMPLPFDQREGKFIVCFAGRVCVDKGVQVLLDAMQQLPPRVCLVIAGDGPLMREVQRVADEPALRGRVHMMGLLPKADLWRLYAASDCLVLPSITMPMWKEQFGGVLADAMSIGLPIVGSDSGAIPQVVGDAGLICPEGDAAELAKALARLSDDAALRRVLVDAGLIRFREQFSIEAYARKLAACMKLTGR
jgi:glycosyltransferase involved in cell wall biosynthesis